MNFDAKSILYAIPVGVILEYFHITWEVILIYAILVVLDTVLGMVAYHRSGKLITSKVWQEWVTKKITRLILPFLFVAVVRGAGLDDSSIHWAVTALMSLLIAGEWYSALRHIYTINTGKQLPEIEVFEIIIQKVGGIFKMKIDWSWIQTPIESVVVKTPAQTVETKLPTPSGQSEVQVTTTVQHDVAVQEMPKQ